MPLVSCNAMPGFDWIILMQQRTADDVSVHDQIIWNLHVNGIDELLLFLGSNPEEVRGEEGRGKETNTTCMSSCCFLSLAPVVYACS